MSKYALLAYDLLQHFLITLTTSQHIYITITVTNDATHDVYNAMP